MRTTLNIDDELLEVIRREAESLRLPLGEVVNRALRRGLLPEQTAPVAHHTITFGDPAAPPPDPGRLVELQDDDLTWLRRKCGV